MFYDEIGYRFGARKQKVGRRWRIFPPYARIELGEGPGKTKVETKSAYLAGATELTSTATPFTVPVTVALLPACWLREARSVLSVVFRE